MGLTYVAPQESCRVPASHLPLCQLRISFFRCAEHETVVSTRVREIPWISYMKAFADQGEQTEVSMIF
ncbi:hypothetical protein BD310DRAFT_927534 [Dichomitus squalens]|uniref:Uncharacterized protein n=1 Tax=Dichomitus squalens TaxID=114155 RepID=A0A4Q9PV03_9APHY|nr:hypothetical protein BD310DRAFT_927534 [Dichomitus squalens]